MTKKRQCVRNIIKYNHSKHVNIVGMVLTYQQFPIGLSGSLNFRCVGQLSEARR